MAELRGLLVGEERAHIDSILERLNNPRVRAREMSRVLSEAVKLRAARDDSLTEALGPTVVTSFHNSVKKDPRPVAEAISPLMGPAIRRSISTALNSMIQALDQTMKHSLSRQGLKWRMEAWRAGKPFAEVVLLHTLVYRVEQVFLIHKESGLLLQHVAAAPVEAQDADIVSGMMTAIQGAIRSFARDSFGSAQNESIDTLDMGDRKVWFEPSTQAVLAAVIRGKAPESLREEFLAPAIEAIQYEQRESLESFDGDTAPFEMSRPHLESLRLSQYEGQIDPAKFKIPLYIWVSLALILLAFGAWTFFAWRESRRWNDYLSRLRGQPGIVVTEEGKRDGKLFVNGLRDPLAADPETILKEQTPLDPDNVISHWESYQALAPQLVVARAKSLLEAPQGVELKFEQGRLYAEGVAPDQWIAGARKLARFVPGVTEFDDTNLIGEELKRLSDQIERQVIRFTVGSAQIVPGQEQAIENLKAQIQRLSALASSRGRTVSVEIIGHTDSDGDESSNQRLSDERSASILSMLTENGAGKEIFSTRGAAAKEPIRPGASASGKEFNRSVSFKISLLAASKAAPQQQKESAKEPGR